MPFCIFSWVRHFTFTTRHHHQSWSSQIEHNARTNISPHLILHTHRSTYTRNLQASIDWYIRPKWILLLLEERHELFMRAGLWHRRLSRSTCVPDSPCIRNLLYTHLPTIAASFWIHSPPDPISFHTQTLPPYSKITKLPFRAHTDNYLLQNPNPWCCWLFYKQIETPCPVQTRRPHQTFHMHF